MANSNYVEPNLNLGALEPDSGRGKIVNHKLKEGDNIFRILPPFGANHNGLIMAEWYLHWGFTDSKGKYRPIVCTKRYEKYCPICEDANEVFKEKDTLIREFKSDDGKVNWKALPEEIRIKYSELNEKFNALRAQRHYYYNAMDDSGKVGILRLPKTAKEKLNAKILDALKRLNFNPTSLENGCSVKIVKVKKGVNAWDVEYDVDLFKQGVQRDGRYVDEYVTGPVPEWVQNNFHKVAIDIHSMYPIRTAAEVKKIMLGDASIFDREDEAKRQARVGSSTTVPDTSDASNISKNTAPPMNTAPNVKPEPVYTPQSKPAAAPTPTTAPAATDVDSASTSAPVPEPTKSVINSASTGQPSADMSPEEQLKLSELKNTLGIGNE